MFSSFKSPLKGGETHALEDPREIGFYGIAEAVLRIEFKDVYECTCEFWNGSDFVSDFSLTVPTNESWSLGALMGAEFAWLGEAEAQFEQLASLNRSGEDIAVGDSTYGSTIGRAIGGVIYVASGQVSWNVTGRASFSTDGNGFATSSMAPSSDSPETLNAGSKLYFGRYRA